MGILRGALNGLGKGLVAKAAIDWERIKQESEIDARKALVELENSNANARLDRQITADDSRSEREITARAEAQAADIKARGDLQASELDVRSKEGQADRASREKIASEGNAAALQVAQARAAGRAGSKIIGYDADGNPIYGEGDGDFKSAIVKEPLMKVERGPDGKLREVPVLDENNQPVMRERLVKFSGKSGANYDDKDDAVDVPDDKLGELNKGAGAATADAAAPAAAPKKKGGVLSQAQALPEPKATNSKQEIANLKGELDRLLVFRNSDEGRTDKQLNDRIFELQNRLREMGVK